MFDASKKAKPDAAKKSPPAAAAERAPTVEPPLRLQFLAAFIGLQRYSPWTF